MHLIVGLGNPGQRYRSSRHNIGFRSIDRIASAWGIQLTDRRSKVVLGRGFHSGHDVVLAKPRTYMNNSGEGVSYLLTRFAAQPQDLLVIYDDMELPLGKLRIRRQGSDGGHNGIRSIISSLKGQDFPRLRVGIGHPPLDQGSIPYLLGSVESAEAKAISDAIATVVDAVDCVITEDMDTAMNRFN